MRLLMVHEPALRAFARSLLPDWNAVDEAIQEASLTLWQKLIVRFKCLSAVGAMRRDRHVFSDGVLEMLADEADALEADDQGAARAALRACLANFSEPHQELLLAPYAGDGRVRTIAEQSGKSANALYKLLGRLREKLSDCVRRNLPTEAL